MRLLFVKSEAPKILRTIAYLINIYLIILGSLYASQVIMIGLSGSRRSEQVRALRETAREIHPACFVHQFVLFSRTYETYLKNFYCSLLFIIYAHETESMRRGGLACRRTIPGL
jgi:hypothetical protein